MIAFVVACSAWFAPRLDGLALPAVEVKLGEGFVDLEPELVEKRLIAMKAEAPRQTHALVAARRGPAGAAGLVQLQESIEPDAAAHGETVRQVFDTLEADLRSRAPGAEVTVLERAGGREVCAHAEAEGTALQTCALFTVAPDRVLRIRAVTCTAPAAEICTVPIASRRWAEGPTLPLDSGLLRPGDLPRAGTEVWGFDLGRTRDAFRTRCAEAGFAVDGYDWSVEPAVVREWFDAGRTSRCGGLPVSPSLGPVSEVSAVFDDDELIGLTVFFGVPSSVVAERLAQRYPLSVAGEDQVLHVIDPEAFGEGLQSATLFGQGEEPARLTFLSEKGARTP